MNLRETIEFALVLVDLGRIRSAADVNDYLKAAWVHQDIFDQWVAYGAPRREESAWGHFAYSVSLMRDSSMAALPR